MILKDKMKAEKQMGTIGRTRSIVINTALMMLVTLALAVFLCCFSAQSSFAEEDDDAITVYFTINDKDGYMIGNDSDHTVMCRVPIKLSYVDLADYGLERYYRYRSKSFEEGGTYLPEAIEKGDVVKQPTVLMLYLKALSKYYLGREITKDDIGNDAIKAITPTQSATSMFMTTFWGHHFNLLYYVNHEYPLMREGWGATADYILLEDGDSVEVQLMPDMEINGFHKFDIDEDSIDQGQEIDMTLYKLGQNLETGSGTTASPLPYYFIRYSMDYGKTWKITDIVSDEEGDFTFSCQNAGVCIISSSKASSGISFNYGLPTAVLHVTPKQVMNGALYTASGSSIKYVFDEVAGAEGYNIFYREQGSSEWNKAASDTNEFVLANAEVGKVYEFKASAFVTDRYVPDGEPYTVLTGRQSNVVSYSVSADSAVKAAADSLALVPVADNVQLSDRTLIKAARLAYDVLSGEQRQNIAPSDISRLEAAEARLIELQTEKDARDKRESTAVTNMITALPSAANVTFDDKDQVNAAYAAYQALSPEGKALIPSISLNKLTNVKAKIDAWQAEADKKAHHEKLLAAKIAKAKAAKTTVKAKALKKKKAKITWKKVTLTCTVDGKKYTQTATGYQVYRSLKKTKGYKKVKTVTKAGTVQFTDTKLKKGKMYFYKLRPYTRINGKTYTGKWSNIVKIKAKK